VRRPDGPLRLREVHPSAPCWRPRPPHQRRGARGREVPHGPLPGRACRAAPRCAGLRVPGAQPPARPDGARERGLPARARRAAHTTGTRRRSRSARGGGHRGARLTHARRALRRPVAAGGDRALARRSAAPAPGRRAHRCTRLHVRTRHHRPPARPRGCGSRCGAGDPRAAPRRLGGPHAPAARRRRRRRGGTGGDPVVGVRAARMRTLLRLALRDAARHRGRSLLAVAVIAVPLTMILLVLSSMTPPATDRDTALGSLPEGTDGIVTATASTEPLTQRPESIPPWIDQEDRFPASPSEISADLPDQARLLEWWNSPTLLMTTDLALDPGDQSRASSAAAVGELDAEQLRTLTLHEASPEALDLLLPPLVDGSAPSDGEGVVISRAAAEHGGLKV